MIYSIPDHVMAAHLEGEAVLLNLDTKSYHQLNETAAVVWKALERESGREEIVGALCTAFDVDAGTAGEELDRLLADLVDRQLVAPSRDA